MIFKVIISAAAIAFALRVLTGLICFIFVALIEWPDYGTPEAERKREKASNRLWLFSILPIFYWWFTSSEFLYG